MPYVPSLEHLDICLRSRHPYERSEWTFVDEYYKSQIWPLGVRSLRIVAYNQVLILSFFCKFIRRFSSALEYLSFYCNTENAQLTS
jgi:hypothetical protein